MSFEVQQWAYSQPLPHPLKTVLTALAWRHNGQDGRLFPSERLIAFDTGIHRRTVQRVLKELTRLGLITVTPQRDESGRLTSNAYSIITSNGVPIGSGPLPPRGVNLQSVTAQHRPVNAPAPSSTRPAAAISTRPTAALILNLEQETEKEKEPRGGMHNSEAVRVDMNRTRRPSRMTQEERRKVLERAGLPPEEVERLLQTQAILDQQSPIQPSVAPPVPP